MFQRAQCSIPRSFVIAAVRQRSLFHYQRIGVRLLAGETTCWKTKIDVSSQTGKCTKVSGSESTTSMTNSEQN